MTNKDNDKAIQNGKLKAQEDASYANWLLMNEYTFDQAMQMLISNKMQEAYFSNFMN